MNELLIVPTLEQVKSSNILAVSYDKEAKELYVVFKQKTIYKYSNVPEEVYNDFVGSSSVGSFFFKNIKKQYQCLKVGTVEVAYSKVVSKKIVLITNIDLTRNYLLMNNEKLSIPLNE